MDRETCEIQVNPEGEERHRVGESPSSFEITYQEFPQISRGNVSSSTSIAHNLVKLPGQQISTQSEIEIQEDFVTKPSSNSSEFNLNKFRIGSAGGQQVQQVGNQSQYSLTKQINPTQRKDTTTLDEIKILNVRFKVKYLQERHKDPLTLLQYVYSFQLINNLLTFGVHLIGLKFRIFILLICIGHLVLSFYTNTVLLKQSVRNGFKFTKIELFIILCGIISVGSLAVYSFAFETPFNSMPIFLLSFFVLYFFQSFSFGMIMLPNERAWNDPNYQMRFLLSRFMFSFFVVTGLVDVFSDIALGLNLIRYFGGYVFYIGVAILSFCALDYTLLVLRVLKPNAVTINRHLITITVEVVIILLTVSVIFGVRRNLDDKEGKEDSFVIILISISTTLVNFSHHVFLVYDQYLINSVVHANLSIMRG
eukprot:TRINITY_DN23992_c1_g1_i2.p1 TRINITY_DN23992_c1_g1~~TRINITY_DN23992_c1_g1_i2.p1  ORF type:complete len:422 (-),score=12.88 TRINITY_DN23992_c1_g1_i2:376-1641(-)